MSKFHLEKKDGRFYITLFKKGLKTPSGGIHIKDNVELRVRTPSKSRSNWEELIVLGEHIVLKDELYDFLCDEGEKVVSGPRGGNSFKFVRSPDGGFYRQTVSGV